MTGPKKKNCSKYAGSGPRLSVSDGEIMDPNLSLIFWFEFKILLILLILLFCYFADSAPKTHMCRIQTLPHYVESYCKKFYLLTTQITIHLPTATPLLIPHE